jgi:polyisoprenoid-binding protein YceI
MKRITLLAAAIVLTATAFSQTWTADKAHSQLGFGITHLTISEIDGSFKSFDSKFTASKDDFSDAVIELSADVNSVGTGNDQRDTHLKSPDFFDAAKFATLTFKSTSFVKTGTKQFKLTGDLTLHGVTKSVVLDVVLNGTVTDPMSKKTKAGFKITGVIKRSDFGIATSFPSAMLSDEVLLTANTEFIKG